MPCERLQIINVEGKWFFIMKSVKDLNLYGKKVLVRVDYNLPMDDNRNITDDNRILASLPLIEYLLDKEAKIILISHMGRPNGKKQPEFSLAPAASRLSVLLSREVAFVGECIGQDVKDAVGKLQNKDILLLENLRFHKEEKANDPAFSQELASLCDVYLNDAFSVSHRCHASIVGIPEFVNESAAGFLLEKELESYHNAIDTPKRPLIAIVGGVKVSSKLGALENMLNYVDRMIIGGAMANTFLKSRGIDVGASRIEEALIGTALEIIKKAEQNGIEFYLPVDLIVADKFDKDALKKEVSIHDIPAAWMGLDIGPKTGKIFAKAIKGAGTIVWNGPMGVFEMERFRQGTKAVADAVADSKGFSVIGGGDTDLAVKLCKVADRMDYISTGGGAFLCLMEGKQLPGVAALEKSKGAYSG